MDVFIRFAIVLVLIHVQLGHSSPRKPCDAAPDYSSCLLKSSCNPTDTNPCGCPHACCAPDTGVDENYDGSPKDDPLPFLYGYRCYKKPRCGEVCFRDALCPCEGGRLCLKSPTERKTRRCV